MDKKQIFIKAVYAGFMIGIGGIVYLSIENRILSALFFSFGLLTIVTQGFCLYTGKIGFIQKPQELLDMLIIIIGNYIGTLLTAFLANAAQLKISSEELVNKKLDISLWNVLLLAVFCGVMMFLAIDNYKKNKNIVFIIAPVMIFILSGFEHSIADMFYFNLNGIHSLNEVAFIIVTLLGNGIGSFIFGIGIKKERKNYDGSTTADNK